LSVEIFAPAAIDELIDVLKSGPRVQIQGYGEHLCWIPNNECSVAAIQMKNFNQVSRIEPADQVVFAQAGVILSELNAKLGEKGQCIPYAPYQTGDDPSLGGAISLALPHRLEGQCGSWRDWVLGITVVRADGSLAKCGSAAVKNVAGYDVNRFFVGARGSLGIIKDVILRTLPLSALPTPQCEQIPKSESPTWVQRVRRCDASAICSSHKGSFDPRTSTLWATLLDEDPLPRYPGDWVIRSHSNIPFEFLSDVQKLLTCRALNQFDPGRKFISCFSGGIA